MNNVNNYKSWKYIPFSKMNKLQFSNDLEKRTWYQEYRFMYINVINPMSNYLKSRLDKLLVNRTLDNTCMADLVKIIHDELEKDKLSTEDKVKIIKENQVRKHK